jgi:hypothetical protein
VPLPEPLAPEVMVIQLVLLVAAHTQPAAVETLTLPVPTDDDTEALVGEIE